MVSSSTSPLRRVAAVLLAGGLAVGIGAFVAPQSDAAALAKAKPTTSTKTTKAKPTKTKKTKTKKTRTPKSSTTKTSTTKTSTTKTSTTKTSTTTSVTSPPAGRNPYLGTEQYVNVDWQAKVQAFAAPISSTMNFALNDLAGQPTAVWLRSISDVSTLTHHLDAALAQQSAHQRPVVVTLVLDDRPARDCQWPTSDASFATQVAIYRQQFLAPVVEILSRPAYSSLRFSVVLEPGSIEQLLVNNTQYLYCQDTIVAQTTLPVLRAALDAFGALPQAAVYLDGVGSARGGWDDSITRLVATYESIVSGTAKGKAGVAGFAVNVGDYAPWQEPFFTATTKVGGALVRSSTFYQWGLVVDDKSYVEVLRERLAPYGWPTSLGVIVDTSRSGWGGSARPTKASTASDVNTFVDASRLDRRPSRQDWCNQSGAGVGERPQATPASGVDAFVWVHNPGASDGAAPGSDSGGMPYDKQCDPAYVGEGTEWKASGALPDAPRVGELFPAALVQLATNAYPALRGLDWTDAPTTTPARTTRKTTTSTSSGGIICTTHPPTTSTSTH